MSSKAEANKKFVLEFIQKVYVERHFDDATLEKFIGDNYIEHNPNCTDGRDALKAFEPLKLDDFEVVRSIADDEMVWLHTKFVLCGKKTASLEIFRLENGKIVEHWDVMQDVPEPGTTKSKHPMF